MVKKNNTAIIIAIIVIVLLVAIVVYSYLGGKNVRLGPESSSPQGVVPARPLVNGCFCTCGTNPGKIVFVIPKTGASCSSLSGLACDSNDDSSPDGKLSSCVEGYGMNL